jgi:glycosyltransferase involved in cell wall biosynthesis/ubiquinone/menaquinone biosynthesis C-methylase UbiE
MKLSIVIPVYNEINTLDEIVAKVQNAPLPNNIEKEIIIVDDYSTDGTRELLNSYKAKNIKIFLHKENRGKGAALKTGYSNCSGDIVIVQDADLEYDPNEYTKLITPILNNQADVVYGSRFAGQNARRILYFWHSIGNKILTLMSNMFSDLNLTDMETCYKVFRSSIIKNLHLEENRFGIEPEVTAKIAALAKTQDVRIYEIGISYYGRTYNEGKKIGFKDGLRAAWCIWKYNSTYSAKTIKYIINGSIIALFQILIMWAMVSSLNIQEFQNLNIANIISIELALLFAFILHSKITWQQNFKTKANFLSKLIKFHLVTFISIFIRIVLFYFLATIGIFYLLNTLICIFIAVIINFFGYDKIVFKEPLLEPLLRFYRRSKIVSTIKNIKNCHLMDIGCGYNHKFLNQVEKYIDLGVGIDFKVPEYNGKKIITKKLKLSDKLPYDDSSFDIVTMLAVLEHLDKPKEITEEIYRILKPGGKLLLTVPSKRAQPVLEFLAFKLHIISEKEILDHKKYYDMEELANLIGHIDGFNIEYHEYFQFKFNNYCIITKQVSS